MNKPKVLRVAQREDCKDFYSIGDDLEYYLDDMKLDNIQGIEFSGSIGKPTRATIKMLVTPDIQITDTLLVIKGYRFVKIKKFLLHLSGKLWILKRRIKRRFKY